MKTLRWIGRSVAAVVLGLVVKWLWSNFDFLPVFYSAYPTEILLGIFAVILLITGLCFLEIALHRRIKLKEAFEVFKSVKKLTPADFHITNYRQFYIERESDKQIENLLRERKYVFITGIPMLGKTRMAYEATKKLKEFYLLKPKYGEIDIQKLKLPFFKKTIVLFLDDLNKYVEKFHMDDLIRKLKKESKDLMVIATCRSGKEFDQVFARKEMETLLTQCQKGKVEPRKLEREEESKLATALGKRLEEIASDGTPGSITIDLRYMKQRYGKLAGEKSILKSLKLLRDGRIFLWKENLVKEVSNKIFDLNIERTSWDSYVDSLSDNGFVMESSGSILISHDVYLDDRFLDDYSVGDGDLVRLKDALFQSNDFENLSNLGSGFFRRENLQEGMDCYQKSIQIKPRYVPAHNDLGLILSDLKRYEEAEKEYKEALLINSDCVEAHSNLGVLFLDLKRYEQAEKEFREALRINPEYAGAHNNLGNLLRELKRREEAEKEYKEALQINPDSAEAHNNLGALFCDLKRYEGAEKEYKEALRFNPDYAEAHNNLGALFCDLKRYEGAEKEFSEALRINPDYADAHWNLGLLLDTLKRYEEGEKEYKEVLRINPEDALVRHNLALLFCELKRYAEAEKEFKEVLRINPKDAGAHYNLGNLLDDLERYGEAEKEYKKALGINPDDAEAHGNLARLLMYLNRKEEAKKESEIARDLFRKQGREEYAKKEEGFLKEL